MANEPTRQIRIERDLDAYRITWEGTWSEEILQLADGAKLEEAIFALCVNWKSVLNAQMMPWFLVHSVRSFWKGYLRGQESGSEQAVKVLAQELPRQMGDALSNMKRRLLTEKLTDIGRNMKSRREEDERDLDANELFSFFLDGAGGAELALSIRGSQRTCYGTLFHSYEHFITECVALARGRDEYRPSNIKELHRDAAAVFGQAIADFALVDPEIDMARLVRNSLVHRGGKITNQLNGKNHGLVVVGDELQIVPDDNRKLLGTLQKRALTVAKKACDLPQTR
jgi:hypothetical protein